MPTPPPATSAAPSSSSTAPRGVALELLANATLDSHCSTSPNAAAELEAVKAELKKWVEHSLQLDGELTKAELRVNETNEAIRRGRGSRERRGLVDALDGVSPSSSEDYGSLRNQRTPSDMSQSSSRRFGVNDHESEAALPAGRTTGLGGMPDRGSGALAQQRAGPDMIRLLLVEDDPFQADAILALCEQCRYQTQVASSALCTDAKSPPSANARVRWPS